VKLNIQNISPFKENGVEYHADTCIPLVEAVGRKKLKFNALARHTYPKRRHRNSFFRIWLYAVFSRKSNIRIAS